jgi:hypothetical protein
MNKTARALERAIAQAVRQLENELPSARAKASEDTIRVLREGLELLGAVRTDALIEMRGEGWSLADMREEFGISRARLSQIINRSLDSE